MWCDSFTYVTWLIHVRHDSFIRDMAHAHVWKSHVAHGWVMSHVKASSHTWKNHVIYEWVMSHVNESCHIHMAHAQSTAVFGAVCVCVCVCARMSQWRWRWKLSTMQQLQQCSSLLKVHRNKKRFISGFLTAPCGEFETPWLFLMAFCNKTIVYGVATIRRHLKIWGLFRRIKSLL